MRCVRCRALVVAAIAAAGTLAGCGSGSDAGGGPSTTSGAPPASPRLFLAGDGELWVVDVAAESARRLELPQLAPGDPPHRILPRGHRLVLGGSGSYVLDPSLERPPEQLAEDSWFFIPSAHEDRIWIAVLDPESPATVNALGAVREMTVEGEVTAPDTRPPGGRWPQRAVEEGLLFLSTGRDRLELWDPTTRQVVRRLPVAAIGDLGPTYRNLLASCTGGCGELRLTDLRSGDQRVVPAPEGFAFETTHAAFSPGGETLALPVSRRQRGWESAAQLALVDLGKMRRRS